MTTAFIYQRGGWITGFEIKGHAGYAPAGADIVCAAVSAVSETTVLGLTRVLGLNCPVHTDEKRGALSCFLPPEGADERAQVLLKTLVEGLTGIYQEYPGFIRIIFRERR